MFPVVADRMAAVNRLGGDTNELTHPHTDCVCVCVNVYVSAFVSAQNVKVKRMCRVWRFFFGKKMLLLSSKLLWRLCPLATHLHARTKRWTGRDLVSYKITRSRRHCCHLKDMSLNLSLTLKAASSCPLNAVLYQIASDLNKKWFK